jgi:hypothetical protein
MRKKPMSLMDPAEAEVVDQITVRPIEATEQDRWDQLVIEHHYLRACLKSQNSTNKISIFVCTM